MPNGSPAFTPRSVEEQVYETLRDRIVRADYEPGSKLVLAQLAEEIGVSTMPVRSALKRLESDGLVTYLANKGATVQPLDPARFEEIQQIRMRIEPYAAELGALSVTEGTLERMRDVLAQLTAAEGSLDDLRRAEWDGYLACYQSSGRERLVSLVVDHRRLVERYTRAATGGRFEQAAVTSFAAFLEGCEKRDPGAAAQAVVDGLERHLHTMLTQMNQDKEGR